MSINNPARKQVVLGVDFGATNLKALILDKDGRNHQRYMFPSRPEQGPEPTIGRIVDLIQRACKDAESAKLKLTGIGVGVCGPVRYDRGEIIESPVLPGWKDVAVRSVIEQETGLTVHVENDANTGILGEWWRGVGRQEPVVAGLTLGTGVGGGLVIDGCLYRGGWGFGAEFGHIRVAEEPECPCGSRGCLGRVASATATLQRYAKLANHDTASTVKGVAELGQLAEQGDQAARRAIAESARYLGKAILVLVNCLNPNVFILSGGMSLLGSRLLAPIREHVRNSTFPSLGKRTRIESAELGLYSGCFGAAYLALDNACVFPSNRSNHAVSETPNWPNGFLRKRKPPPI